MAEPKQDTSSEETPDNAQDPETTTLQAAMAPAQGSAQAPDPQIQTMADVLVDPKTGKIPATGATEASSANQAQAQNNLAHEPVVPQTPVVSPVATATDIPANKVNDSNLPVEPASSIPELSVAQKNGPGAESIQQILPVQPDGSATEQITVKPVGPQAVTPEARQTETVQPQPVAAQTLNTPSAPEPSQAQPLSATSEPRPEQTSKPAVDIQSLPQETSSRAESKTEPLNISPAEQKTRAEAPEPIQVTHPIQQTITAKLESSHEQPDATLSPDTSETEGGLQSTQSTTPVVPLSETQAKPTSEAPLPRSLDTATTSVARQIQDSIAQGIQQDSRQIVLRLDPPELGRVAIKFHESDQGITGVLEVQRSQTRQDIQQALPEIVQHLQNNGVQIKRIEVLLSADADSEGFEDQAFSQAQDQNLEQQQTFGQNTAHRSPSFRWPSSPDPGVTHSRQPQYVSDQGINMLI